MAAMTAKRKAAIKRWQAAGAAKRKIAKNKAIDMFWAKLNFGKVRQTVLTKGKYGLMRKTLG